MTNTHIAFILLLILVTLVIARSANEMQRQKERRLLMERYRHRLPALASAPAAETPQYPIWG